MKRIFAIFTALTIVLSLSGCFKSGTDKTELNIYVKNAEKNELTVEKVKYSGSQNTVDMANFAISELNKGPSNKNNIRSIPENVTFSSVSVKNEAATIDASKEFTSFEKTDELLARFAVVRTLCDIPGISSVLITVEGEPLISDETGKEVGYLSRKDIVLDIDTSSGNVQQTPNTTTVKLYFSTSDATALKAEERRVVTQNTLSIEKTVINELLKGPSSPELISAIPDGTKLLNIETRDGICYVNFSSDLVNKFAGGTGMLAVYSIVNTLCSMESIVGVQILIEGEKGAVFGNYVFDEPFDANMNLVQRK